MLLHLSGLFGFDVAGSRMKLLGGGGVVNTLAIITRTDFHTRIRDQRTGSHA